MFFNECRAAGGDTGAPAGGRGGYNGEKGGAITIDCPGQHVVQRSSVVLNLASTGQANVEARFTLAMPARGRTILGSRASLILTEMLPHIVTKSLFATTADLNSMRAHVFSVETRRSCENSRPPQGLLRLYAMGPFFRALAARAICRFPRRRQRHSCLRRLCAENLFCQMLER